ncbi:MAG: type II toxin-antitoxin system HicA family toxin [bacterium]|nr:type II toxin-antitoxin system HicA family toxin [bacterium]
MKPHKVLQRILAGSKNIRFEDMLRLAEAYGFYLDRVSGSHHILVHPELPVVLNLQNVGGQAKPYQIKQFLKVVEEYNLSLEAENK